MIPLNSLRKHSSLPLPASGGPQASLGLWQHHCSSASIFTCSSPFVCVSYKDTSGMWFTLLQYESFSLILSTTTLVPNKDHILRYYIRRYWASLVAQLVKNPPAMRETWVQSLGWEEPLEKGKAAHSSILAWRIPWGHKELDTTKRLSLSLFWGTGG